MAFDAYEKAGQGGEDAQSVSLFAMLGFSGLN